MLRSYSSVVSILSPWVLDAESTQFTLMQPRKSPTGQAYLSRGLSSVGWEVLRITGRAPEAFPRPQSAFDVDRSQRTSSIGLVEGRGLFCGEFKVS